MPARTERQRSRSSSPIKLWRMSGFLSQIAALQLALRRLPWTRWQADIVACIGGRLGLEATFQLSRWLPHLADVTMVFPRKRATDGDYDGQIDELYRAAPVDPDVL